MNEQANNTNIKTLKNVKASMTGVMFGSFFVLISRFLRTYTDYKAHPSMYSEPYSTWLESLKIDFILYGMVILICIIVISVLKITLKKRSKMIEP